MDKICDLEAETGLEIRKAEANDLQACTHIYANGWNTARPDIPRRISLRDFQSETEGELILVAVRGGQILGFVSIWEPDWFIHLLYVDPALHREGYGIALIAHAKRLANGQSLSLKCQRENIGATGFYEALGFVEDADHGVDQYGAWVRLVKANSVD